MWHNPPCLQYEFVHFWGFLPVSAFQRIFLFLWLLKIPSYYTTDEFRFLSKKFTRIYNLFTIILPVAQIKQQFFIYCAAMKKIPHTENFQSLKHRHNIQKYLLQFVHKVEFSIFQQEISENL